MNLSVQHLSDEAAAAYTDGVLSSVARARADRHLAECPECAFSIAEQRAAVWALRAAPAPSLPVGLLDRLRELPTSTELPSSPVTLAPDGSAVFPAYGVGVRQPHSGLITRLMPMSIPARRHAQQVVLGVAAIALVTLSAVSSTAEESVPGPNMARLSNTVDPGQGGPVIQPVVARSGHR